jgi:hypothetical protein
MALPVSVAAALLAAVFAQLPAQNMASQQRVTVAATADPDEAGPGESVSLLVDVSPRNDFRVFAPGANDFTAVVLKVTAHRSITLGKPKYPVPEREAVPGTNKRTPVYDDRFQLEQPIVISKRAKSGETIRIVGVLTYQACDERTAFAKSKVPVFWTITVR